MIITKKLEDTPLMENAHNVDARNLYNTEHAVITVLTLNPGQTLKRHKTPVDAAFFVLSGVGIVEIGEEKLEVGANTFIESPKEIMHCWYNESDEKLVIMVIKSPKPNKPTKFVA